MTGPDLNAWHVVHSDDLLDLLRRASAGEDPDLLYAELWANSDHSNPSQEAA